MGPPPLKPAPVRRGSSARDRREFCRIGGGEGRLLDLAGDALPAAFDLTLAALAGLVLTGVFPDRAVFVAPDGAVFDAAFATTEPRSLACTLAN